MRISDWSSDVCSSDLAITGPWIVHATSCVTVAPSLTLKVSVRCSIRFHAPLYQYSYRFFGLSFSANTVPASLLPDTSSQPCCAPRPLVGMPQPVEPKPAFSKPQLRRAACREKGVQYG